MKPTPCLEPKCYKRSTKRGRCENHQLPAFESGRRERLPDDWYMLSRFILERDERICHICGGEGADGVDHIVAGDDHAPQNLAAIHHHTAPYCHRYKTAQEGNRAKELAQAASWGHYWEAEYRRSQQKPEERAPF